MMQSLFAIAANSLYKGRLYYARWLRCLHMHDYHKWWQPQVALTSAGVGSLIHDMWPRNPPLNPTDSSIGNGLPTFNDSNALNDDFAVWFAVPKQKISRMKKRMKTTLRKRIPLRHDIITDPRTGELTLRHKLPFNWKNYLPNVLNPPTADDKDSSP
jgi:ribosomal protein L32